VVAGARRHPGRAVATRRMCPVPHRTVPENAAQR